MAIGNLMDSECIEIDPKNNESTQPDEVESVEKEVGAKRKRKDRSIVWNFFDKDEKAAIKGSNKVPCKCKKCKTNFLYDSIQGTEGNPQYDTVDGLLKTTFDEYASNVSFTTSNHATTSSVRKVGEETSDDTRHLSSVRAKLLDFDEFQNNESTTNKKSELQLYLEEPRMERTLELDVLAFWKSNEFRYPVLASMARDFLTIPISTVASESTFSASGRVLDQHRSSLGKETLEALICTKDWLFAGSNEVPLEELAEDIMSMSLDGGPESGLKWRIEELAERFNVKNPTSYC
ncbi:AC transposase [Artemisia annua]|uniref:AC transposase n=1 Tax=Artemisia annua TaxID=35608 RepID=A0A2U1NB86_ARTAN|nr:AC transposase [Artemisia annua]